MAEEVVVAALVVVEAAAVAVPCANGAAILTFNLSAGKVNLKLPLLLLLLNMEGESCDGCGCGCGCILANGYDGVELGSEGLGSAARMVPADPTESE